MFSISMADQHWVGRKVKKTVEKIVECFDYYTNLN